MSTYDLPQDERTSFPGASVVQLIAGDPSSLDATVAPIHPATVMLTDTRIVAVEGDVEWAWLLDDLEAVHHGSDEPWSIFVVPGVADHGVALRPVDAPEFRRQLDALRPAVSGAPAPRAAEPAVPDPPAPLGAPAAPAPLGIGWTASAPTELVDVVAAGGPGAPPVRPPVTADGEPMVEPGWSVDRPTDDTTIAVRPRDRGVRGAIFQRVRAARDAAQSSRPAGVSAAGPAPLVASEISAWFGSHYVLDRVSLEMPASQVTALIGPSGCGKSTFLRILNRMHELIPSAALAGEVLLDGQDVYDPSRKITDARREIGMVFQKPNPFPAMSIYDNVVASLQLTGTKATTDEKDEIVETCLSKAGLWNEVRDRLRQPGGGLSGGQQQRLCIARALAIRPRVLLMDEPCSALDPTSTRRIEQTIHELAAEVTIVIVTHNMQQALRVSNRCAFFLAEQGTPGVIVEHGPTDLMFDSPQDQRTSDYVTGRFG